MAFSPQNNLHVQLKLTIVYYNICEFTVKPHLTSYYTHSAFSFNIEHDTEKFGGNPTIVNKDIIGQFWGSIKARLK